MLLVLGILADPSSKVCFDATFPFSDKDVYSQLLICYIEFKRDGITHHGIPFMTAMTSKCEQGYNSIFGDINEKIKTDFNATVKFVSEIISVKKDKDNKIIEGNPDKIKKVTDYWKFSKNVFSKNPNWYLSEIVSK